MINLSCHEFQFRFFFAVHLGFFHLCTTMETVPCTHKGILLVVEEWGEGGGEEGGPWWGQTGPPLPYRLLMCISNKVN